MNAPQMKLATIAAKPSAVVPDINELLKALRRRWPSALGLGLVAATVVGCGAYLAVPPSKYKAQAILHVATNAPRVIIQTAENRTDFMTYLRGQVVMLKSRTVLSEALNYPEIRK